MLSDTNSTTKTFVQSQPVQMEKELPLPKTSSSSASASPSLMASISRSCSSVEYLAGSSVFCK